MEYNKLIPKQLFMEKRDFVWNIADFVKMRNNQQALELQHFYFKAGSTIELDLKWKCFLKMEEQQQNNVLRPNVELVGDIPQNAHFLTVMLFITQDILLSMKADTYQADHVPILNYCFQKRDDLLEQPMRQDGALILRVHLYVCNMKRIPPNISQNALMTSMLTWFYETKFIDKWKDDLVSMYKLGFDGGHNLGVKLITKDGREFVANMAILGIRSPVFRSMFQTPMVEAQEGIVKIDDISGPAFEALLSFIYTGMLPGNWKRPGILEEFIYGAFKYMLEDLQRFLGRMLVFLFRDEEQEGNTQHLGKLADMLNIKMEEDWNVCLESFVKEEFPTGLYKFLKILKSWDLEPKLVIAILGTFLP